MSHNDKRDIPQILGGNSLASRKCGCIGEFYFKSEHRPCAFYQNKVKLSTVLSAVKKGFNTGFK